MHQRGVTLIEMVAVVAVLLGITGIAIPMLGNDAGSRLGAAAMMLRDDLEQVRHRTIADPSNPLSLMVDADGRGWRITPLNEPAQSIERHDGESWEIVFGEGRAAGFEDVRVQSDAGMIWFDARGVLGMDEKPKVQLSLDGRYRLLDIGLVTGLVKIRSP